MAELLTWSTTANSNNSTPPDGFPEGMFASQVNNSAREVMAALARYSDMLGIPHINVGFTAAVASNDLTVTLKNLAGNNPSSTDPVCVFFRNTTLATGQRLAVNYTASTSVVLPGGGSLGFANSETDFIYIWAVYDGTNRDIGVSRTQFHDHSILHSTTTIGTGSDATGVIYTTTGRTNAAIRLLGRMTIQYGTANWTNAPTNLNVIANDKQSFTGVAIQSFTTPGANTYTPTTGMKYCIAISTGGGGGGAGADTDGNNSISSPGAGGGSGATCIGFFTAAQIGASQTVTIGIAGTAGANTGGTGGTGGDTTFGSLHTAGGGVGGGGTGIETSRCADTVGGAGGTATGGTVNIDGGRGRDGTSADVDGTTDFKQIISGDGASSFWGAGGPGLKITTTTLSGAITAAGRDGVAYGSGGGGAICSTNTSGSAGGAGKAGISVVIEFV